MHAANSGLSRHLHHGRRRTVPAVWMLLVVGMGSTLLLGCGTVARTTGNILQLPFKAAESGVRQFDRALRQPGQFFDQVFEGATKAAGAAVVDYDPIRGTLYDDSGRPEMLASGHCDCVAYHPQGHKAI